MNGCFKWVVILWTVLIGALFLVGMLSAGEAIDKAGYQTEAEKAGAGIGVTFGAMLYAFIWAVIALPAVVLYFVTRPPSIGNAVLCPHCGSAYSEGAKFCSSCGKPPK